MNRGENKNSLGQKAINVGSFVGKSNDKKATTEIDAFKNDFQKWN